MAIVLDDILNPEFTTNSMRWIPVSVKVAREDFLGGITSQVCRSINYVGMSKDMGKRLPQLYYIKMKISYDLGFIAIGVAIAT